MQKKRRMLRKAKKKFKRFASRVTADGEKVMTVEDFLRSVLPKGANVKEADLDRLRALFVLADSDQNGVLSFAEYFLFTSLMTTEDAFLRVSFKLFDINGDGYISIDEFREIIRLHTLTDQKEKGCNSHPEENLEDPLNPALLENLMRAFGNEGTKSLNYTEFIELLKMLNHEILVQQFRAMECLTGYITPQDFSRLLLLRLEGRHMPAYILKALHEMQSEEDSFWASPTQIPEFLMETISENILFREKVKEHTNKPQHEHQQNQREQLQEHTKAGEILGHLISLEQYLAFNTIVNKIDEIELAIELYTAAGGKVTKAQFGHAASIATGTTFSEKELDMVFGIFDTNKDGKLDADTLRFLYKNRQRSPVVTEKQQILSLVWSLVLGTTAAKIAGAIVYPFDWLKTRLQLEPPSLGAVRSLSKRTLAKDGWKGFLLGLNIMLMGIGPEKVIKLFVSDWVREKLRPDPEDNILWIESVAGFVTGIVQALICNPYEQIKLQVQMRTKHKRNGYIMLYELGLRNAFRGLSVTLCRDIPFNVVYFMLFAIMKEELKVKQEDAYLTGSALFLAHAIAAILAVFVSAPADCIKTHYQHCSQGEYPNPMACFRVQVAREGWDSLWKGSLVRIMVVVPLYALTFIIFETLQRWIKPGTILGLRTWQQDLDTVRKSRLLAMQSQLKDDYGLDVGKIVRKEKG